MFPRARVCTGSWGNGGDAVERAIERAIERVRACVVWVCKHPQCITQLVWVREHGGEGWVEVLCDCANIIGSAEALCSEVGDAGAMAAQICIAQVQVGYNAGQHGCSEVCAWRHLQHSVGHVCWPHGLHQCHDATCTLQQWPLLRISCERQA